MLPNSQPPNQQYARPMYNWTQATPGPLHHQVGRTPTYMEPMVGYHVDQSSQPGHGTPNQQSQHPANQIQYFYANNANGAGGRMAWAGPNAYGMPEGYPAIYEGLQQQQQQQQMSSGGSTRGKTTSQQSMVGNPYGHGMPLGDMSGAQQGNMFFAPGNYSNANYYGGLHPPESGNNDKMPNQMPSGPGMQQGSPHQQRANQQQYMEELEGSKGKPSSLPQLHPGLNPPHPQLPHMGPPLPSQYQSNMALPQPPPGLGNGVAGKTGPPPPLQPSLVPQQQQRQQHQQQPQQQPQQPQQPHQHQQQQHQQLVHPQTGQGQQNIVQFNGSANNLAPENDSAKNGNRSRMSVAAAVEQQKPKPRKRKASSTAGGSNGRSTKTKKEPNAAPTIGSTSVGPKDEFKKENTPSTSRGSTTPTDIKPMVGSTEVDSLMLIIQAQTKHAEKVAKGETMEPFKLDSENKLIPASGSLNGGVGKRSSDTVLKYKCEFPDCNKSFSQKTHLEIHGRSHTGERPYKCDFEGCGKTFTQRGNLRTHRRSHTGEKPYQCEICKKQFAQRGNFRAHKLIHEEHRPYYCKLDQCDKSFTQLGNLKAHQNKFHQAALQQYMEKFKFYLVSGIHLIPQEEVEMFNYFAEMYKNSNRGIKGRGKSNSIARSSSKESSVEATTKTITSKDGNVVQAVQQPTANQSQGSQQAQPPQPQSQGTQALPPPPQPGYQYAVPTAQMLNQAALFQGENGTQLPFQMGY